MMYTHIYIYIYTHSNQITGVHDYNFLKGSFREIEDMRYASFLAGHTSSRTKLAI